jgi:predicted O-methyltransferase YrrM
MEPNLYGMIREMKEYAQEHKVPIMLDEGIEFLTTFLIKHQITSVLEIGTAIGYSAIKMALASPHLKIVTIERDEERYMEALKNIKKFNLEDRITLIFNDALEVNLNEKFDLIFLDGAKGKNIEFLEHFERNLEPNGFFVTDNIGFHGFVEKDESEIKNKNLRGLIRKIKAYIQYLKESTIYNTTFYDKGDGIAVTSRKEIG